MLIITLIVIGGAIDNGDWMFALKFWLGAAVLVIPLEMFAIGIAYIADKWIKN
jgi:hypothetical protein